MLDVHAPHEKIHGFRDFLLHLLTITVGLLIALALEGAVETAHHRHQREQAESTIKEELRENRRSVQQQQAILQSETESLYRLLTYLQARSRGQSGDPKGPAISVAQTPLRDAAWRSAGATGVLAYVNYSHVQQYAAAYKLQNEFEILEGQTLDGYLEVHSIVAVGSDPLGLSKDDASSAISPVRRTLSHLAAMQDLNREVLSAYDAAEKD